MFNVLVIDSGFGGARIAKEIKEKCNNLNVIFFVENKYAPLGDLSASKLLEITKNIVDRFIQEYQIQMLVLACNTLTSACICELRNIYDFEIVGTEPNVKVQEGETLVLGTKFTISNCKILKNKSFNKLALPKLSVLIDKNYPNFVKCKKYLQKKLKSFVGVKNVIIGCTHYSFIKTEIKQILGNDLKFYESCQGVANRVASLTKNIKNEESSFVIILSKNKSKKDKKLLKNLNDYLLR